MELYDINNRRLSTRGTLSVSFQVVGEERPEQLTQSFIVVDNITESCVLGLDALYEQRLCLMDVNDPSTGLGSLITSRSAQFA